jgi:2'-5' RNA ligase
MRLFDGLIRASAWRQSCMENHDKIPALRLFVAVVLPAEYQVLLDDLERHTSIPTVRWTKRGNLHITVQFLGRVPVASVSRVGEALSRAAPVVAPYILEPARIGWGPDETRPSMVWLHFADSVPFRQSVSVLRRELSGSGLPFSERDPVPHVTYGRLKQEPKSPSQFRFPRVFAPPLPVTAFTLCSSVMTETGPVYRIVDSRNFGDGITGEPVVSGA